MDKAKAKPNYGHLAPYMDPDLLLNDSNILLSKCVMRAYLKEYTQTLLKQEKGMKEEVAEKEKQFARESSIIEKKFDIYRKKKDPNPYHKALFYSRMFKKRASARAELHSSIEKLQLLTQRLKLVNDHIALIDEIVV